MDPSRKKQINLKISLGINLLIAILTLAASAIMFSGFRFMQGHEPILESTKLGMLKFFTVESNLLMGFSALCFAAAEIQVWKGKRKAIPLPFYLLKLAATSGVGLTFFVVFAYLGPISEYGIPSMLMNSNLFFHLIIPVLSVFVFIFFERSDRLRLRHSLYGLIPTALYEIYYLANVLIHMENGSVSPVYDWYWFVQNGVWTAVIVSPGMLILSYLITILLLFCNRTKVSQKAN